MYRIRDWSKHFERDRTKQWKTLQWVPIPNKQGLGYRKIMSQENGAEIFGCWIAIVEIASKCEPRGDMSKYTIDDLSELAMINVDKLKVAVRYLSEVLDWIENIENLDINVKNLDVRGKSKSFDSSILSSSILSSSENKDKASSRAGTYNNNQNVPNKAVDAWNRFKRAYPTPESCVDPNAEREFAKLLGSGTNPDEIISGAKKYADYWKAELGDDYPYSDYISRAHNFLVKRKFLEDWERKAEVSKKNKGNNKNKHEEPKQVGIKPHYVTVGDIKKMVS